MTLNQLSHSRYDTSNAMASWLERDLRPNVYAVGHVERWAEGMIGCHEVYDDLALKVLVRLSKQLYGEKNFSRRPEGHRLIPNAVMLERETDWPHVNMHFRRPDWISFEDFGWLLEEIWWQSPWSAIGTRAFWCEERQPGRNPLGYSLKEGTGALLLKSLTY
jgi:hypothetical protein